MPGRSRSTGPEEVGPARQVRIVGLGDRLDLVGLARRQHQRLGAVVLDATAQVLDSESIARRDAELLVVAVHDEADDVLQDSEHRLGHELERFDDLSRPPNSWLGVVEPAVEVVLAGRAP